jgi:hypothetical protein
MRYFGVIVAALVAILSCSSAETERPRTSASGAGGGGGTDGAGGLGPIAIAGSGGSSGSLQLPDGGSTVARVISDGGDTLTVSGQPVSVPMHLELDDGSQPSVVWSVDDTRIGSIGSDGTFRANGFAGGVVTVIATVGSKEITTKLTVNVDVVNNSGALSEADQTAIRAGGAGGDTTFKWLYPYDRTVFPRGLTAPPLQFGGTAATAMYVKITVPFFSYQQFVASSSPPRVVIPEPVWKGLTLTAGSSDAVQVEVTKLSGTEVTGPLKASWFIARANLKGIVYYSTYKSPLTNDRGGVMRIRAGQTAEVVKSGCTVCHSVSANGNVLAASRDNLPDENGDWNPVDSATYDLTPNGTVAARTTSTDGRTFAMAALTPDGSRAVVGGLPPKTWPPFVEHGVYSSVGFSSSMVDTATGQAVSAPSLSQSVKYAITPAFSPDGTRLAYVNGDRLAPSCLDAGCSGTCLAACKRVISLLDYDGNATPPAFSNARDLVDQAGERKAVAWPTFLPDGNAIVYHEGDSLDSSGFVADGNAKSPPQYAELRLVDVQTKTVKTLDALNGRLPSGESYLPFGATEEGQLNFEPSVLPLAVGGYYWVLFTSRRAYGNTISPGGTTQTVDPANTPPGKNDPWGTNSVPSWRKKIWIAAIDIDHSTKGDPSHPAFYLPGQEVESANMRAFAALAPCKADGSSCESGADCCNGFCRQVAQADGGDPVLVCIPPPNTCSNIDEKCSTAADCCDPTQQCINSRCSYPPVDIK